jgi:hypothetical protein
MLKGEKIGLIPIGKKYMPGTVISALIQDVDNGNVTCEIEPFSGISTATFIIEDYLSIMFVMSYFDGVPASIHLKRDEKMEALFSEQNLKPRFIRQTLRYEYGLPQNTLDAWAKIGVLTKKKVDWHYACPECDTMVTVREGCYNCYAATDEKKKLMRHKKCGFISYSDEFFDWKCSGCKEMMDINSIELVLGPGKCECCGYADVPTQIAGCLSCGNAFPMQNSRKMHVFQYEKAKSSLVVA